MKKNIISLLISKESYSSLIDKILILADKKQSSYICIANVHMTIEAYLDKKFADIVNNADVVTPDGMPLVVAMRLLYGIKQERVTGMDLLPDILKLSEKEKYTIFFYGSTKETLEQTKKYLDFKYPLLKNHHYLSPPFRKLKNEEELEIIKQINDSGANIVFVVLGCPKQEKWMANMKGRINACMIGIGGALPVMIGIQKRAPIWMQKLSLEWLYRLIQEPKRLFKRYLITNSFFIYLIIKELIKIYIFKKNHSKINKLQR